jgi:hypothetical protein
VTAEQLRRSTGFPVDVTDAVPITPTPDPEQLGVLRELIDPTGTLNEARRR